MENYLFEQIQIGFKHIRTNLPKNRKVYYFKQINFVYISFLALLNKKNYGLI